MALKSLMAGIAAPHSTTPRGHQALQLRSRPVVLWLPLAALRLECAWVSTPSPTSSAPSTSANVGAPTVWNWLQVPGGDAGCVGKEAICDIGGAHFFVGDDIWIFDGTRPVPVADGYVRQSFFDNSNPSCRYKTICVFDRQKNLVWVFYPSLGSTTPDSELVYHVTAKKWGAANRSIEAALNYVSGGVTIDGLSAISPTIGGLSSYSFDSQFWLAGGKSLSIFNTSHQLQSMTGISVSSSMTTGDVGDDDAVSLQPRALCWMANSI